jgi:transcriptional/translational regulatory protein YebC/TACO1
MAALAALVAAPALAGEDAARMQKLLDVLEDLDDTQDVFHNAVL